MPKCISLLMILVFSARGSVPAQKPVEPPALHYEVVSIHESRHDAPGLFAFVQGDEHQSHIAIENYSYASLIVKAFGIRFWQLEKLPASVKEQTLFNLQLSSGEDTDAALKAMSDDEASEAHERMLQEVLVERFGLKYHWMTRSMPAYVLVAGKQPKLHRSAVKPPLAGEKRRLNRDDPNSPWLESRCGAEGCSVELRGFSTGWIANTLSVNLQGPVVDRSGLAGLWDFKLEYASSMAGTSPTDENRYPPIEAAVVSQLGLRVERGKAPIRMLVVDHLEPPTSN